MNKRNSVISIAVALGLVASSSAFAAATHAAKAPSPTTKAQPSKGMPTYLMVELDQSPTMATYGATLRATPSARLSTAKPAARAAAISQLSTVKAQQASTAAAIAQAKLPVPGMKEIYRLQRVFNGILYQTDAANMAALRAIPGVKSVSIVHPKTPDNGHTIPFIGVPALWNLPTSPIHGENVKVGVIDTGIDYLHANFGGPGTVAAYNADNPNVVELGSFPTAKVVGGLDLAGANYDASNPAFSSPTPDADPIDHVGHGSHVAGTIAGYGVNNDGSTYAGPYDNTLDTTTLRIGPGAAPKASLYALKVFGDGGGSTNLDSLALEIAVDPNGDGDPSDHLDVVNLSLGSPYGSSLNTDSVIFTNAVQAGMVVVVAAGNSSDFYFTTGSPGATPEVISVAATDVGDSSALRVNSPAAAAGLKAMGSGSPDPAVITPFSGNLATTTPVDGCAPIAEDLTGKFALIVRGGTLPSGAACGFVNKVDNAQAKGAIAVIIYNQSTRPNDAPASMTLDASVIVPARSLTFNDGTALAAAVASGPVNVTLDDSLVVVDPTKFDMAATFTARGPAQLLNKPLLKPDVAAPGVNIISTGAGTGSGSANESGTSMATPLTAGVMALLKQLHPTWTPGQLKALVMNTATHDVFVDPTTTVGRRRAGPARVGAGRVDAQNALNSSSIAYDKAFPDRVSITFNTVEVSAPTTEVRTIEVANTSAIDATYTIAIDSAVNSGGTTVTPSTTTLSVAAGHTGTFNITLQADPTTMTRAVDASVALAPTNSVFGSGVARDWQSETSGWVTITPASGPALRVPYYGALTPASAMSSSGSVSTHGDKTGTSHVFLKGNGTDTTSLRPEPFGILPTALPMELHYVGSGFGPLDYANIHYAGVTNNATEAAGVGATEYFFGVNTFGAWGAPGEITIQVNIKAAGSPVWQYALVNVETGNDPAAQTPGSDVRLTALFPLDANGNTVTGSFEDFVNGVVANSQFVPAFLTDTMVLPVFASDLNLPDGFDYQIQTYVFDNVPANPNAGTEFDETPILHYTPGAPALSTAQDPAFAATSGGFGFGPPFQVDLPGHSFAVNFDQTVEQSNPASGLLLLHLNNAFGQRAEVLAVSKAEKLTSVTRIPTGDANCRKGGEAINTGFDDNGNGTLEAAEITSTQNVCNGDEGAKGDQGPASPTPTTVTDATTAARATGAKGCTSFGGGASFLTLIGLLGMYRRRRQVIA